MTFAVMADNIVKIKENQNGDKYFDFARELKKLWKIKMTVIPIVIGVPRNDIQRAWRVGKLRHC